MPFWQLLTLFRWQVLRYVRQHLLLSILNAVSIALGVAVYLAVQIANDSAAASFSAGVDLVAGKANLEVRGEVDENLWPKIAAVSGVKAVTGIVETIVTLPDLPGEYLRLAGVDVFTSAPFAAIRIGGAKPRKQPGPPLDLDRWLGRPGAIAITAEFAERHQLQVGQTLRGTLNARTHLFEIVALIDTQDSTAAAQPRFAAMDLGWAQELTGIPGRLSSIQILLDRPQEGALMAQRLQGLLPADLQVAPPRQRSFQMQTMLSAFRLNLTALSLVSLLVGAFFIYNTVSASVARRRVELGILRALGAKRWQIRALFLGEALAFGILGIALGFIFGIGLARITTGAVEKTVSSLYTLVEIQQQTFVLWQFAVAAGFGIATVLVGAWIPADEAARTDPVRVLRTGAYEDLEHPVGDFWNRVAILLGLVGFGCGSIALLYSQRLLAFAAAFCALAAFAALAPDAIRWLTRGASGAVGLWRLAVDRLGRAVHRNAITVAALGTAIAMAIGLAVMIYSFRRTVVSWMEQSIVADLYIAPSANETVGLGSSIPDTALSWLRQRPEVVSVDTFSQTRAPMTHGPSSTPVLLAVIEGGYRGNLDFGQSDNEAIMRRILSGEAIAVTEPFSRKYRVGRGDRVQLQSPSGPVHFSVAGVYRDYTRDEGLILMSRSLFLQHWRDLGPQSLAVFLQPQADPAAVTDAFLRDFGTNGEFSIYSNRVLRERIMRIFDQTFAVTEVLRIIAVIVAVLGIALSVTTLVAERQRETGMLRAVGASTVQVRQLFMMEASLVGAVASALGCPAGLALALVLTWVVNPVFFGWTINLGIPWMTIVSTPFWIIPAAALAAWWPARHAAHANLAESIREE